MIFGNNIFSNIFQVGYAFQKGNSIKAKSFLKALNLIMLKLMKILMLLTGEE